MRTEIRGNPMTIAAEAWQALADWKPQKLTDLVVADPDAPLQALVRRVADILFDFATTHHDARAVAHLSDHAAQQAIAGRGTTLLWCGLAYQTEGTPSHPRPQRADGLHHVVPERKVDRHG